MAPPTSKTKHRAQVAELVDAPASGAGARKGVEVRVLSWAPSSDPHGPAVRFHAAAFGPLIIRSSANHHVMVIP